LAFLFVIAWVLGEVSQWLLRYRAEKLLVDIRSLEINRSKSEEAQALLTKWREWGEVESVCNAGTCHSYVFIRSGFPEMLRGGPEEGPANLIPRIFDQIGLRTVGARAGFTLENGVVTSKGFVEMVALPVHDWFLRGNAYVPELAISVDEASAFSDYDLHFVAPSHPFRMAHFMKGPYGVIIKFKPEEQISEQTAMMDFHFSCMTQFFPCHKESDILPASAKLFAKELSLDDTPH